MPRRPLHLDRLFALALLLLAAGPLSCRRNATLIAVIPRATAMPLWEAEHAGAQHAADGRNLQIYWNAPTREEDIEGQIQLVERIIDQRYGGLVLAPDQPLALMTAVRRAIARGIPTVIVGAPLTIPPGANLSYIINDDAAAGRMAAARVAQVLGGSGKVAVIGIDPNSPSALDILHTFESALERDAPGIAITERRAGAYRSTESGQMTDEVLAADPDLGAIFSLSAAGTSGAHRTLLARGRVDTVRLIGFQQTPHLMAWVRSGQVDSLIAENTYQMGYQAVQHLAAHADGAPMGIQTLVEPTLLTAQNVDSPSVQQLINMNWSEPE